jgi:hypothetical protein
MKKRDEETSLANGELWEQFKKTLYFEELDKFMVERIRELRDNIVSFSMSGKHEEARDLAQKLSGFLMVSEFIDDTISTRAESLEFEREAKEFNRQLPHRL